VQRAEDEKKAKAAACVGKEDTRNCIKWLKLEPVDTELKALEIALGKQRRTLVDAELRASKADERANPKIDPGNLIKTLVGNYQITQVVTGWIAFDREVDIEQVDRCGTCHMGSDSAGYTDPAIPAQLRSHPHRSTLFATHPVEKFGCTSCHQGQGRATDELAHSGWHLEEHHGKERWHFAGDHYWEDPMLPIGHLSRIIVDDKNDELEVRIGKGKWEKIAIEHRTGELVKVEGAAEAEPHEYHHEGDLYAALQTKLQALVDADAALKAGFHAVVRRIDNRIEIGVEQNDPTKYVATKDQPVIGLRFPDPELANMLGFVGAEATAKLPLQVATRPPSVPVRSEGMASMDDKGRFHPPRGSEGLQVPDDMRNRFIQGLPEVESGCLRCHGQDVDLRPRRSHAKYVNAKLEYQKAEAWKAKDLAGYKKAHGDSEELPAVLPDPESADEPVPTFVEGRNLFKQLNCTGCHILDGFPWDKNAGPSLDNVSAKVSPEWMLTWLRDPRGWRAKTIMPNLWPKPLDPGSKRPYPESSPEYAKWDAMMRSETVAIASFLYERSENPAMRPGAGKEAQALSSQVKGYANVPGATAEKGKIVFESYGCQGCHARADGDTAEEKLPDTWRGRERDLAPTLSNLAEKTTADWIAYWVENPSRYWHGTRMPNLRLTREESASVGLYLVSMKSAPLHAVAVDKGDSAIVGDAAKRNEKLPCATAGGALMTRVECGEKLVAYYGCFGCHQIGGFENYAPVAPELGGFAKKDVTTLDFGYAIADHHLQTTETFATLKLDSPRIYRRDRIELKMGDYDLSPREIRALVIFLKGLTPSKPKEAFDPLAQPAYVSAIEGRQLVDDLNCRGCHVIEGRGAEIDQFRAAKLSADGQARAPFLNGEGMRVQPEWLFTFLRDPGAHGIRPWLHPEWVYGESVPDDKKALRMPQFNLSNEEWTAIVRYFAAWDGQAYPYQTPAVQERSENEKLWALTHMNAADAANCLSCHYQGTFPKERGASELEKMAPNLNDVRNRLRPEWVQAWLLRPQNYLPYTKMTAFWVNKDRPKDSAHWPQESDPFLSTPPAWNKVPGFESLTGEQQAAIVRDFLYTLEPDSSFLPIGEEANSPLVKGALPGEAMKNDGAAKDKDKAKKPKKTGQAGAPARF
jgi:cytochrome c2